MKKNKAMRTASVLLVLTLLTTSIISGTFAKYVTKGSATDTARVAKWGVTVTGGTGMFGTAYKSADGKISATYSAATDSVHSSTADKVVAPGTGDTVAAFTFGGTPEVDYRITYTVDSVSLSGWTDAGGTSYLPLVFKVGGAAVNYTDADSLKSALQAKLDAAAVNGEAGTAVATAAGAGISVTWEWPFSTSSANDIKDTYLGDQAAAGNAATVSISISATVTQVD